MYEEIGAAVFEELKRRAMSDSSIQVELEKAIDMMERCKELVKRLESFQQASCTQTSYYPSNPYLANDLAKVLLGPLPGAPPCPGPNPTGNIQDAMPLWDYITKHNYRLSIQQFCSPGEKGYKYHLYKCRWWQESCSLQDQARTLPEAICHAFIGWARSLQSET